MRDWQAALRHWEGLDEATAIPLDGGLINLTLLVRSRRGEHVLQRVNPIFDPAIHDDIAAVTACLRAAGLLTPELVPARDGRLAVDLGEQGLWRLSTFIPGASFSTVVDVEQARSGGCLVGRFHGALSGCAHRFRGTRQGVHDTAAHMLGLERALARHEEHRLHGEVAAIGGRILDAYRALEPLPKLAPLVGHGDLKLDNLRFAGADTAAAREAKCLVDLDTTGPIHLGHELGDMWRSWCNRGGEEAGAAAFDLEVLAASWDGYREGLRRSVTEHELQAALLGVEHIALELAARFARDALEERYFGFDASRYPARGEANLVRARSQLALFAAVVRCRSERARILGP